jgi:hypothetical protein
MLPDFNGRNFHWCASVFIYCYLSDGGEITPLLWILQKNARIRTIFCGNGGFNPVARRR